MLLEGNYLNDTFAHHVFEDFEEPGGSSPAEHVAVAQSRGLQDSFYEHSVPFHLGELLLEPALTALVSSDVATSSNACLGPQSVAHPSALAPAVAAFSEPGTVARPRAPSVKRKGSPRGSPPRKFAFAGQKPKDMQP